MFFLHIFLADAADLPDRRRQHGFDNRDFQFQEYGAFQDGACPALVPLPDYEIAGIRTGQYAPVRGPFWQASFPGDGGAAAVWLARRAAIGRRTGRRHQSE